MMKDKPNQAANISKGKLVKWPQPAILSWNLTGNCNLKCVHCYLDASASSHRGTLFDAAVVRKIATEARQVGIQIVFLSGGEPLLLPELPAFITILRDCGLQAHICTNLTLLTPQKARELKSAGLKRLSVGIDHVDRESFELFRGAKSYESLIRNLELCRAMDLDVNIDYTLTRQNADAIDKIHAFATRYGCEQVSLKRYVPAGRGKTNADRLSLTPSAYRECLAIWALKFVQYSGRIKSYVHDPFFNVLLYELNGTLASVPSISGCKAGGVNYGWLGISPDGSIHPCPLMRNVTIGNVFSSSLKDALYSETNFSIALSIPESCRTCEALEICRGGCRAAIRQEGQTNGRDAMCWRMPNPL